MSKSQMNEALSDATLVSWKEEPHHTRRSPPFIAGIAGGGGEVGGRHDARMVRAVWRDALQCCTFLFSCSCFEIHRIYFLKLFVSLFI